MSLQVNDILLAIRSRLNDTDANKYRWSTEELIDMINSSLANLSRELFLFTHQESYIVKNESNRYKLPHNCIRVISVLIGDETATIKSFDWMSKNKHEIDNDNFYVCMDEQSFFLYPSNLLKNDIKIELNYNFIEQVNTNKDTIPISLMAKNALLFYSMHLAHQINTSKESSGRSTHYMRLYDKEIEQIRALYYKNKHSKKIKSPYIKV